MTITEPGAPPVTQTVTVTNTVTATANCPPGAQVTSGGAGAAAANAGGAGTLSGSLAYTGQGDDPIMSLLGGAMTAAGLTCLIMARRRWGTRRNH